MHKQALRGAASPISKPIASRGSRNIVVRAQAQQGKTEAGLAAGRRSVLALGAGGLLATGLVQGPADATELKYLEVDQLSTFQRSDQQNAFRIKVESILNENLDPADSPIYVRLALHDAGTYDSVTKTGGFDGSIVLNAEELSRPENKGLDEAVRKLKDVKAKVDEQVASPISWADLIYLAGKISTQKKWFAEKTSSPEVGKVGGEAIAKQFPNPWQVSLGRVDSSEPGPNRAPPMDADVNEIREWLLKLGAKPGAGAGPLTPKPPFWEKPGYLIWTAAADDSAAEAARLASANPQAFEGIKKNYDRSRATYTRTDYEVDFAVVYNKLCNLGAKFDSNAYLSRIPVRSLI